MDRYDSLCITEQIPVVECIVMTGQAWLDRWIQEYPASLIGWTRKELLDCVLTFNSLPKRGVDGPAPSVCKSPMGSAAA